MWNSVVNDKGGPVEELIRKQEEKVSILESYSCNQSNSLKAKSILKSVKKTSHSHSGSNSDKTNTVRNYKSSSNARTFYNNGNIFEITNTWNRTFFICLVRTSILFC